MTWIVTSHMTRLAPIRRFELISTTLAVTKLRTYEQTHPWLSFKSLDLRSAPYDLWMMLGEARSKIEHLAGVPLRPDVAERLHRVYLAKGALASTAIEGNTLSEEQVLQHLEGKLTLPPSQKYLAVEVDNVVAACNEIIKQLKTPSGEVLTDRRLKQLNKLVLTGLEVEEGVVAGEYRSSGVVVGRYLGAPAADLEYLVGRLCQWLSGGEFDAPVTDLNVAYAIIKAVIGHVYFVWIHPFGDGNGRTARLIELQILMAAGVPIPATHLLSNHYNHTRTDYYRELDRAHRSGGDLVPFLRYAVRGFVDQLRQQINWVREQQIDVAWENYVHSSFDNEHSSNSRRQRWLVLDLSDAAKPVPRSKLPSLSPRLAKAYSEKTSRTVYRDLRALVEQGLIRYEDGGFVANRETMLAFLPWTKTDLRNSPEPEQPELPLK